MDFLYKIIRSFWIKDHTFFELLCFIVIVTSDLNWWQTMLAVIVVILLNNVFMDALGTRNERR